MPEEVWSVFVAVVAVEIALESCCDGGGERMGEERTRGGAVVREPPVL